MAEAITQSKTNYPLKLLLGSQSPRRRELLAGLGIAFSVVSINADESYPASLEGEAIPIYISRAKAAAYADRLQPDELLITADTIVWLNGQVLGKPHDEADARRMLRRCVPATLRATRIPRRTSPFAAQ